MRRFVNSGIFHLHSGCGFVIVACMAQANYNDRLKDYVQVNERIIHFYEQYPTGSIQSEMLTLTETLVVFKAFAFRHPDDPKPGVGHSSLAIPGTTPYTEGSEIENAETSAWGRALAALGFEVKRGIASRNEIENKLKPDNAGGKQSKNISNGDGGPIVSVNQLQLMDISGDRKLGKGYSAWLDNRLKEINATRATLSIPHFQMLVNELADMGKDDSQVPPADDKDLDW